MEQLLRSALAELEQGEPVAFAAITAARGSTPRSLGAVMAVGERGVLAGTIGGGELEFQCAGMALSPEKPLLDYDLNKAQAAEQGMVCGGSAQVLFTPLTDMRLLRDALERITRLEQGWLLLPLDGGAPALEGEGLSPYPELITRNKQKWLSLPLSQPGQIYLMGGGHVAMDVTRVLDVLGYPYVVVDDREEFSSPLRFPNARRAITAKFTELDKVLCGRLTPGPRDCLCVVTRGHLADADVLRFALGTKVGYIGLMGSRRKREQVFAMLAEAGFPEAQERVVTPIGVPIGGQTPAEVAVSIAAQLVQWRDKNLRG